MLPKLGGRYTKRRFEFPPFAFRFFGLYRVQARLPVSEIGTQPRNTPGIGS